MLHKVVYGMLFCVLFSVVHAEQSNALIEAAKSGDTASVRSLIAQGVDVNAHDASGLTALYAAAKLGHVDIVKELLQVPSIDLNILYEEGGTPLMAAAYDGNVAIVEELLQNPQNNSNLVDKDGLTALHLAVDQGHQQVVDALLNDASINVNVETKNGLTPLMIAASLDALDAVKALLEKQAKVNSITLSAKTALDLAQSEEVQDVLRQHGGMSFFPIWQRLLDFIDAVNTGNLATIGEIVKNKELAGTIQKVVDGGFNYYFTLDKNTIAFDGPNKVTVQGAFKASKKDKESSAGSASTSSWSMEGFSTYYTLEKEGDQWFITDTNFASKLSFKFFWSFLVGVFLLVGLAVGFWLWMLIDCATHEVNHKALWIIFLIFGNVFAAIIYYFAVKRTRS